MKTRKQLKTIGLNLIKETLKKEGVLQFNSGGSHIEVTQELTNHIGGMLHSKEFKSEFFWRRNGMVIVRFHDFEKLLLRLNDFIGSRTKVNLFEKVPPVEPFKLIKTSK